MSFDLSNVKTEGDIKFLSSTVETKSKVRMHEV